MPSELDEETAFTTANTPSITNVLLAARDPSAPGVVKSSVASFPATSFIDPPFSIKALVSA